MNMRQASVLALALAFATSTFAAPATQLLPPQAGDLVPTTLQPAVAPATTAKTATAGTTIAVPPRHIDHTPARVSWALRPDASLAPAPKPITRHSREYWTNVSQTELQNGVNLPVSTAGAIVRLSPEGGAFGTLDPKQVHVTMNGKTLTASDASKAVADAQALRTAGMAAPSGTLMLRLRSDLGAGHVTLRAKQARGRYVVHVYEPKSPWVLSASTNRPTLNPGDALTVNTQLSENGTARPLASVGGFLQAPDGSTRTLNFTRGSDGRFHANVVPDASHGAVPGLWEAHVLTSTPGPNGDILRDATTVFALSPSDARLSGDANVQKDGKGGLNVTLGVTVASASRFAVAGVLYGQAADGSMKPFAYAQSASWLQPGNGQLTLNFARSSLAGKQLSAPYELRDLRLMDQGDLGLLERRTVALRFNP